MTLRTVLAEDADALSPHLAAWDALAVEQAAPFSRPAWMLAWWRHTAPPGGRLRTVLVFDGDALVGVAPYFVDIRPRGRADHRILTSGICHRMTPLATPGREPEIARAIALALAAARPRATFVSFEGFDGDSPWPRLLRETWPGLMPPGRYRSIPLPSPVLPLDAPDFETWFAGRSKNFRSQLGKWRRRLEKAGGEVLLAREPEDVEAACAAFPGLHIGRWEGRGGSNLDGLAMDAVLRDVARDLAVGDDLRLWCVKLDGRMVSVQVFIAAGGELGYWSGGWDEETAHLKPPMVTILAAIEDAYRRGERRLDFGGGDQDYKLRFTETADAAAVSWGGMFPPGPRYPLSRAEFAPRQVERTLTEVAKRLPPEQQDRLRRIARRPAAG